MTTPAVYHQSRPRAHHSHFIHPCRTWLFSNSTLSSFITISSSKAPRHQGREPEIKLEFEQGGFKFLMHLHSFMGPSPQIQGIHDHGLLSLELVALSEEISRARLIHPSLFLPWADCGFCRCPPSNEFVVALIGSDLMLFRQNNRPNNYAEYLAEQY